MGKFGCENPSIWGKFRFAHLLEDIIPYFGESNLINMAKKNQNSSNNASPKPKREGFSKGDSGSLGANGDVVKKGITSDKRPPRPPKKD